MTTLTVHAFPAVRVPVRALSALNVLWRLGRRVGAAVSGGAQSRNEPSTPEELLTWSRQLEATQPSLAADLRAAALAAQIGGIASLR